VITTPVHLSNLRSLSLHYVDVDTAAALLDPIALPRLEELAWYDSPATIDNVIVHSSFHQLLPQLEVVIYDLRVLITVTDAEVRSAVSRTLVDCGSHQLSNLRKATLHPVHLRVYGFSNLEQHTGLTTFSKETVEFANYIESNPSLPLRSVYLTCADPATVHLSSTSQGYVGDLSRICQQRKIDLIFGTPTRYYSSDPCMSPEFSRRMKERKRRETVG